LGKREKSKKFKFLDQDKGPLVKKEKKKGR